VEQHEDPEMEQGVDPGATLFELAALANDQVSDRKRRLFAVAYLSRFWDRLEDPRSRRALEVAARFAAGLAGEQERRLVEFDAYEAHAEMRDARFGGDSLVPWTCQGDLLTRSAALAVSHGLYYAEDAAHYAGRSVVGDVEREEAVQIALVREILGPPSPPRIDPFWLASNDSAVTLLARCIDAERAFDLMPILADALEDAGCDAQVLLDHCRGSATHVPGCWVIDALLGKP
jgi:hypothetical protein